jgi:secondary thiamine-phosphate synthase enzyme
MNVTEIVVDCGMVARLPSVSRGIAIYHNALPNAVGRTRDFGPEGLSVESTARPITVITSMSGAEYRQSLSCDQAGIRAVTRHRRASHMTIKQTILDIDTHGRGTYDITGPVKKAVTGSGIDTGLCHVFVHHTSASLMLCENADPAVRRDLERWMQRIAPDGDPLFEHADEGPDDMSAHVRTLLTKTDLTLPVSQGDCALGTWQGIYLWEHRTAAYRRRVTVTVQGE